MDHEQAQRLERIANDVALIKRAVLGEEATGLTGLVHDMAALKKWRIKIDLRSASIAGIITTVLWLIEHATK